MARQPDTFQALASRPTKDEVFAPYGRRAEAHPTFQPQRRAPEPETVEVSPEPVVEQAEASSVPDDADVDWPRRLEEAHAAGVAEAEAGAEARAAEMTAEIASLRQEQQALQGLLEGVRAVRAEALRQAARDVGDLVVAVVQRVVGDSLALHPDALAGVVEGAVAALPDDEEVVVRVPVGFEGRVAAALGSNRGLRVVPDAEISAGCVVQTTYASIEASLDAAMEGIEAAVDAWLATHPVSDDLGGARGMRGEST